MPIYKLWINKLRSLLLLKVFRGHQWRENLLNDYSGGSVYNSHEQFSKDHTALKLIIYYDDVEIYNPMGSRAKKYK